MLSGAVAVLRGWRADRRAAALAVLCAGCVYFLRAVSRQRLRKKPGRFQPEDRGAELLFRLVNCRYDVVSLRRYCSAVGYGWDYPESIFRDIPLLYPQFLCSQLISMITSSPGFRLSPYGLVCVSQRVRLLQPVDELKRGVFSLQVGVGEYRSMCGGVEVDLSLSLRTDQQDGWSSTITLLSPNTTHTHSVQPDTHPADDSVCVRYVRVSVPWWAGEGGVGPGLSLLLPSHLLGYGCPATLWAVSRCVAEIEKIKGTDAVCAPLALTVRFAQPLRLPKSVTVSISELPGSAPGSAPSRSDYLFNLEDQSSHTLLLTGEIRSL